MIVMIVLVLPRLPWPDVDLEPVLEELRAAASRRPFFGAARPRARGGELPAALAARARRPWWLRFGAGKRGPWMPLRCT